MKKLLLAIIGAAGLLLNTAIAEEPTSDLSPKDAVRLISLKSEVPQNAIEIPFIVEGSSKVPKGFEVRHVRRVACIHSVREDGAKSRRLVFYDFYWNEYLGWFLWETRPERAGDAVYIWSELRGKFVIR